MFNLELDNERIVKVVFRPFFTWVIRLGLRIDSRPQESSLLACLVNIQSRSGHLPSMPIAIRDMLYPNTGNLSSVAATYLVLTLSHPARGSAFLLVLLARFYPPAAEKDSGFFLCHLTRFWPLYQPRMALKWYTKARLLRLAPSPPTNMESLASIGYILLRGFKCHRVPR
jgi:hypothetical protein